MEFKELVRHLCQHPSMYVAPANFATVAAYLCGFNRARDGGPLCGFREWLIVRVDGGNNLTWDGLVTMLCRWPVQREQADAVDEEDRIVTLGAILAAFFDDRDEQDGLTKIFQDYGQWLVKQDWYTGPLRGKP